MTAADRTAPAISVTIRNVVKRYGAVAALDNVSLSVAPGEFVTLLGPSGSGKTTLLMVLAGFVRPNGGSVMLDEDEIVRLPPHKRNIGMVFQNYALFPHMTVAGNIAYPLKLRGAGKPEIVEKVGAVLDLMHLGGFGERRVDQLSGGQRQRVALARAIVFEPRILLMDEPLSALDKQLRERMQIEIRRLHDRLGMTTIAVTHDQREALTMSDRVAVLHKGKLVQFDTPRNLYDRPAGRFAASFIGESSFLKATVEPGGLVKAAGSKLRAAVSPDVAGSALLLVRPEKLVISPPAASEMNRFTGTVRDAVFQGESVLLSVALAGGEDIQIRVSNRGIGNGGLPPCGTRIELGLDPADTVLIPEDAE